MNKHIDNLRAGGKLHDKRHTEWAGLKEYGPIQLGLVST